MAFGASDMQQDLSFFSRREPDSLSGFFSINFSLICGLYLRLCGLCCLDPSSKSFIRRPSSESLADLKMHESE